MSLLAAKSLQLVFSLHGGNILVRRCDHVCSLLTGLLEDTNDKSLLKPEVITLMHDVMNVVLTDTAKTSLRSRLFDAVLNAVLISKSDKVWECGLRGMKTMAHVALCLGAPFAERCLSFPLQFITATSLDTEIFRAAINALGHCFPILYSLLSVKTVYSCFSRLVCLAETNVTALQSLCSMVVKVHDMTIQVPPDLLEQLCGCLTRRRCLHQHLVLWIVRDAVKNGSELTSGAQALLINYVQMDTLPKNGAVLTQATFEMLTEIGRGVYCAVLDKNFDETLSVLWKILKESLCLRGLVLTRLLETVTLFFHTLCTQLPSRRRVLLDAVLQHVATMTSSVAVELYSGLLGGIVWGDNGGLLEEISSFFSQDESRACLCVGTVGCSRALSDAWKTRLVQNFESATSEMSRFSATLAISRASVNPQNVSLILQILERAITAPSERSIYWGLIKETALIAASRDCSSFADLSLCEDIEKRLLENALEDDVETTAAVLGAFAPFNPDGLLNVIFDGLKHDSESVRAACIHTQRYLLLHLKNSDRSARLTEVVVTSLQTLKRTAGVRIRFAALQLFVTVLSAAPQLLFAPIIRDAVYPNVLAEIIEDPSLILNVNLGNYTHRQDKGIEIRRLAFECISLLLCNTGRVGAEGVLLFLGHFEAVLQSLVYACGPQERGEVDGGLNNQAKILLVRLVRTRPTLPWSDTMIMALCEKLRASLTVKLEVCSPDVEKNKVSLRHALYCVTHLAQHPPFVHTPQFQELLVLAQQSPLLEESMRLVS